MEKLTPREKQEVLLTLADTIRNIDNEAAANGGYAGEAVKELRDTLESAHRKLYILLWEVA
jgi:hypothetical protein